MKLRRIGAVVLSLALLLAACANVGPGPDRNQGNRTILLVEVYPVGYGEDAVDQYIRLHNPTDAPVDLSGHALGDLAHKAVFPAGARIGAGESIYIGRTAAGFQALLGVLPDYTWGDDPNPAPTVPSLTEGEGWMLPLTGGAVILWNAEGKTVDALAYGEVADLPPNWRGAPVPIPLQGEVIDRGRNEATWTAAAPGAYVRDTDTAADWKQGNEWVDLRVLRPGQTWFGYPTYKVSSLTAYASPDTSFEVLADVISKARESIDITVYDFSQVHLAEALAAAARRGVRVRMLLEAGSEARLFDGERYAAAVVNNGGGEVRWIRNDPGRGVRGRYVYNHAKFGVIDGKTSFVQSENFVRHGVPADPSGGNRGWGAIIQDDSLSGYLSRVFEADWNPAYGDVVAFEPGTPFGPPDPAYRPDTSPVPGTYPHPFPVLQLRGAIPVTPVLAPEHALLEQRSIIGMIRGARHSVYVQQQYAYLHWGPASGSIITTPDLYLDEMVKAARRGLKVRLLLSDAFLEPDNPKDNTHVVAYLNRLAKEEGLDLQARIIDSKLVGFDKIHNKGVIADEKQVLISSINWSYNSPANNREVGLIVADDRVGQYYTDIFTYDWYNGAPADYPLITEVNAQAGYVELTHFGPSEVDISGWSLATHASTYRIPEGTRLRPGRPILLAADGATLPDVVPLTGLNLRGQRGAVALEHDGYAIDRIRWGEEAAGWKLPAPDGDALCRPTPGKDTNSRLDWQTASPTPGIAGCGE